jgi:hypothetical protein
MKPVTAWNMQKLQEITTNFTQPAAVVYFIQFPLTEKNAWFQILSVTSADTGKYAEA